MPTIITHALVPLTVAMVAGSKRIPHRIALVGAALAMLPDMDVIGLHFGVAYGGEWGHRGAMHSLAVGVIVAAVAAALVPGLRKGWAFPFLVFSIASHGLLDTLTDGGRGVALLWPFDQVRIFAPWRPIRVSPIGAHFFTRGGLATAASELKWVWLPCLLLICSISLWRRYHLKSGRLTT